MADVSENHKYVKDRVNVRYLLETAYYPQNDFKTATVIKRFEGRKDKISTSSHSTDTPTLNKKPQKRLYTYNLFRNFLIYL